MARAPAAVRRVARPAPARGLVDTIARSWRDPRGVMAAQVAAGLSEPRALVHLMLACGLVFVARLPMAVRSAEGLAVDEPVSAAVSAQLFAWGAVAPLLGYGLAAAVHLVARAFGGRGGFLGARAALFWSGLAVAPAVLAIGLVDAVGVALTGRALPWLGWLGFAALGALGLDLRGEPRRDRGLRLDRPRGGGGGRRPGGDRGAGRVRRPRRRPLSACGGSSSSTACSGRARRRGGSSACRFRRGASSRRRCSSPAPARGHLPGGALGAGAGDGVSAAT